MNSNVLLMIGENLGAHGLWHKMVAYNESPSSDPSSDSEVQLRQKKLVNFMEKIDGPLYDQWPISGSGDNNYVSH